MDSKEVEARVSKAVVNVFGRAPGRLHTLVGGRRFNRAGAELVPEVSAALRLLAARPDRDFTRLSVETARKQVDDEAALFGGRPLPMALVEDVEIPTFAGGIGGRRSSRTPSVLLSGLRPTGRAGLATMRSPSRRYARRRAAASSRTRSRSSSAPCVTRAS